MINTILFLIMMPPPPSSTLFPYTTLFRSGDNPPMGAIIDYYFKEAPKEEVKLEILDADGKLRSEEHTSELQSRGHLVCRLLLEKKKHISSNDVIKRFH